MEGQGCIFFLEKETIPERPSKIWKLFRKGIFTILFKPNSELHVVDFTHTVVLRTNGTSAVFSYKISIAVRVQNYQNIMINSQFFPQLLVLM